MLNIRHETLYRYTEPISYTIQQLRLTPRAEPHQQLRSWSISSPGQRRAFTDAYGNLCHMLTMAYPHNEVRIVVEGTVEVMMLDRGRLYSQGQLPPMLFTVPTRLTEANDALKDFARRSLRSTRRGSDFLLLADAIVEAVAYRTGATEVSSTAADALALGQGVCQDHAHLFLACCHVIGVPARYVSGYIDSGSTNAAESHAWVDVWVEESGIAGWVSIDVTHARFQDTSLCRLAVGRDYESASPIRGVRRGGGMESLSVRVDVSSSGGANQ